MKAFLTGLGIGVALGVLFARDSGDATRKKLGARLSDWSESLSQKAENVKTAARAWVIAFQRLRPMPPKNAPIRLRKKLLIGNRRLPRAMISSIRSGAKNS
jgi:hypothetical protein